MGRLICVLLSYIMLEFLGKARVVMSLVHGGLLAFTSVRFSNCEVVGTE